MGDFLNEITSYLLAQSWQIAVLVVAVAATSCALRNRSAHVRYLLWLIVLAKCLVPPFLTVHLAVLPEKAPSPELVRATPPPMLMLVDKPGQGTLSEAPSLPPGESTLNSDPEPASPRPSSSVVVARSEKLTPRQWLGIAWILGAAGFLLAAGVKAIRNSLWLYRERKPLPAQSRTWMKSLCASLGLKSFPKVWLVSGIGQPFVWGLLRGSIYLPADFIQSHKDNRRRDVLGHELSHILRFDAAINLLQLVAQAMFWFHPFLWWANKRIRSEREKCCDETAIARLDANAEDYGAAIIETLTAEHESTRPVPSLAVAGPLKNIEERIKTIMKPGKEFYRRPTFAAAATALLLAVFTVPTAFVMTRGEGSEADNAPDAAEKSARKYRDEVIKARAEALAAKEAEVSQRQKVEAALRRAEREHYYNVIALAGVKIGDSLFDQAEALLWDTPRQLRGWEWGRLMQLCHQDLLTLKGHSEQVRSVSFSPDGKRVVTGSWDKTAKIWDAESGQEILTLKGHSDTLWCVAFSPDGKRVVTGSVDKTAKIWDAESGQEILTLKGHSDMLLSVAFSSDGRRVVTGSRDKTAKIWDAESGEEILTLKGHSRGLTSVAFSPDGKRLVTGSDDGTAKIWDAESGEEILTLKGHSDMLFSVAFSSDGRRVVTGSADNTAKIWDAESGQEILTLKGHSDFVFSVAFSPDGRRVMTGSLDATAKIWDAESGQEILTLNGHSSYRPFVGFFPGGKPAVTGSADNTAKIWDAESGQEILTLKGHSDWVLSLDFSPDGKRVVTGSRDKTAKIWNAESGQEILTLRGHSEGVNSVDFSPDGKRVVTGSYDTTAKIWDAESDQEILTLKGHSRPVGSVGFSPDGKRVVTGSWDPDNTAKIWDAESGREILTLKGHSSGVTSVSFSPDGKRVVTGSHDRTAKVWDAKSGREILTLKGHSSSVSSVSFSPYGKRVLTGSWEAKIWDAESGWELLTLKGHPEGRQYLHAAFSPDGKRVVTGSHDTVNLWQAFDWKLSSKELESQKRERYRQWLERHRAL